MKSNIAFLCVGAIAALGAPALAAPINVSFTRITSNASVNVENQFNLVISDATATQVVFLFTNNVGVASSISEIYFDTSNVFTGTAVLTQVGTSFAAGPASPGNLPGGNTASPPFVANQVYSADAQGNPSVGINTATDSLTMTFTLASGTTYADLLAALQSGAFRVGFHVRSIAGSNSDSFVNVVPTPGCAALMTLGGLAALRRRR